MYCIFRQLAKIFQSKKKFILCILGLGYYSAAKPRQTCWIDVTIVVRLSSDSYLPPQENNLPSFQNRLYKHTQNKHDATVKFTPVLNIIKIADLEMKSTK